MIDHAKLAAKYFVEGYNCAQAVVLAFCDVTGLDEKTALRISSSFGGGMGRLREVCGACSGMFMVAGLLYGYDELDDTRKRRITNVFRIWQPHFGNSIRPFVAASCCSI